MSSIDNNISRINNQNLHADNLKNKSVIKGNNANLEDNISSSGNNFIIKKDQLEISEESYIMNKINSKANELSDQIDIEDENRLIEIKNRIKNGFYQTDGVISSVIDNFLDEAVFDTSV